MWRYKSESRENWGHDVPELRSQISQYSLRVKEIRNILFCSKYSDKKKYEKYSGIHRSVFEKWTTPYNELQFNTRPYWHLTKIDPFFLTRGHEL